MKLKKIIIKIKSNQIKFEIQILYFTLHDDLLGKEEVDIPFQLFDNF